MLEVKFIGPPLEQGPLPAIFYFALSAHDSLYLDPFNQPVECLKNSDVRIFSITLPGHDHLPATEALTFWTDELKKGNDVVAAFTDEVATYITELVSQKIALPEKIGVMGLSRGAFIAAHVAAKVPQIQHILGFAPLTRFGTDSWDLSHLSDKIYNRTIRFYIGNHDTRVGTDHCSTLIVKLADTAFQNGIRTSPIDLIIGPSIGRDGHGTSPKIFQEGALWMQEKLR